MRTCIVGTTFSKTTDDLRFQLNCETVKNAVALGFQVYVVDGSPIKEIGEALAARGAIVFPQREPGMGRSRSQCLNEGLDLGFDIICWTELEKTDMPNHLAGCITPVEWNDYDMIVPRRDNLETYPDYQHWSELRANWEIGHITGRPDLDLMVGTRIMNRRAAIRMANYQGEPGKFGDDWQILFHPVLDMIANREFRVGSVTVPYRHPAKQTAAETGETWNRKRDKQRLDLVNEMRLRATLLKWKGLP